MSTPIVFESGISIGLGIQIGPVVVVEYEYLTTQNDELLMTESGDFLITE
jgi:hypothetical protein